MDPLNDTLPTFQFSSTSQENYLNRLNTMDWSLIPAVLHAIRELDDDDIWRVSQQIIEHEKLPSTSFLLSISPAYLRTTCIRACLLIFTVTRGRVVPRQFQLEAALETIKGNDSIVIAGTGHGKTLCIVIPLILQPRMICIVVSPLKRLQTMQVKDFRNYCISTVAINEDTPKCNVLWKQIEEGHYSLLVVQPEQFRLFNSHLPRLAQLLHERKFVERIKHLFVDEAHNTYTAGEARHGQSAFRPAWGALNEVRARLLRTCSCQPLSATIPKHILRHLDCSLGLKPNRKIIRLSINRPNISYAIHPIVGTLNDFRNLSCIIPQPFHPPMRLPKLLIIHDNRNEAANASSYLNSRLPPELQSLEICKHYHSEMSAEYLEKTFASFSDPEGSTIILNGTSGAGTGLDIRGIEGVIQYGVCTEVCETIQRGGRGGRDEGTLAFFLIMVEPWVFEYNLDTRKECFPNSDDPDRPFSAVSSRKISTKMERCGLAMIMLVQSNGCIRCFFAEYLDDDSPTALEFITTWCCNCPIHPGSEDTVSRLFLGPMYTGKEEPAPKRKPVRNSYRPTAQREPLEKLIRTWLSDAHANDPLRFVRRASSILDDAGIKTLVMALPSRVTTVENLSELLNQNDEWRSTWAFSLLSVLQKFELTTKRMKIKPAPKQGTIREDLDSGDEPLMKKVKT